MYTGFWWEKLRERNHGRPRRKWEDNIKKDLQKLGCGGMDWTDLPLCSVSTSIRQGSWFRQSRHRTIEVLFLTHDMVRRPAACTIQLEHTSAQERLLIKANFADRSCWSMTLAARRRSAVLTRPSKSTRASSVSAGTNGAHSERTEGVWRCRTGVRQDLPCARSAQNRWHLDGSC